MVHMESVGFVAPLALLVVSGVLNGTSVAPLKYAKRSEWENLWLVQSIVAMIVLPWLLVWMTVHEPMRVYRASGFWPLSAAAGFGFGWGIGTLLYIIGVVMVGMSVSFAIILSLTATLGSLFPLLVLHPHELHSQRGHLLLLALVVDSHRNCILRLRRGRANWRNPRDCTTESEAIFLAGDRSVCTLRHFLTNAEFRFRLRKSQ